MSSPQKFVPCKRHCDNCNGLYTQTRADHRFDKPTCRAEWHRNGGSYGKVLDTITRQLPQMIRSATAKQYDPLANQVDKLTRQVETLTAELARLRRKPVQLADDRGHSRPPQPQQVQRAAGE